MLKAVKNTNLITFFLGVFLVSGCCVSEKAAQRHLLRLTKCNPSLIVDGATDTIVISKTYVDTVATLLAGDTIIIEKERLKMRVMRFYDTLRVQGICEPDTLYITKQIAVAKETKYKMKNINWSLFVMVLLLSAIIVYKV